MIISNAEFSKILFKSVIFYSSHNNFYLQDMLEWIKDKQEVEVVDLVLRLRSKLVSVIRIIHLF